MFRRNCLLKHVIEEKIVGRKEVTGRQGRRRKQLVDDIKEVSGYGKLKEEALDGIQWRIRFGRSYGPVIRQTRERISYGLKTALLTSLREGDIDREENFTRISPSMT